MMTRGGETVAGGSVGEVFACSGELGPAAASAEPEHVTDEEPQV